MRLLMNAARAIGATIAALLLAVFGPLWSAAHATSIVAQTQTNTQPSAPPIVFLLLLGLIFVAVLAFSFMAFRDVNR